jgi:pimeloyl-ACP methyl ester carboxylesterase
MYRCLRAGRRAKAIPNRTSRSISVDFVCFVWITNLVSRPIAQRTRTDFTQPNSFENSLQNQGIFFNSRHRERAMSKQDKPNIVFVHGIWADGSSFSKLIPALQGEGHEVIAAQYGLGSLAGDVAAVKSALGRVRSPAILVSHSYGGTLITAADTDARVIGLVYIAALAPDADETSQSQQSKFPVADVFSHIEVGDGRLWLKPTGVDCFAGDLPEQEQKLVWATHAAPAADLFDQKVDGTAWKSKPSWYVVAGKDRTVQPDLQRFFAKRMGATVVEVESSHVPMLSKPWLVLDVIRKAAIAVQKK